MQLCRALLRLEITRKHDTSFRPVEHVPRSIKVMLQRRCLAENRVLGSKLAAAAGASTSRNARVQPSELQIAAKQLIIVIAIYQVSRDCRLTESRWTRLVTVVGRAATTRGHEVSSGCVHGNRASALHCAMYIVARGRHAISPCGHVVAQFDPCRFARKVHPILQSVR
jgi:hypothetical protein